MFVDSCKLRLVSSQEMLRKYGLPLNLVHFKVDVDAALNCIKGSRIHYNNVFKFVFVDKQLSCTIFTFSMKNKTWKIYK